MANLKHTDWSEVPSVTESRLLVASTHSPTTK